MGEKIICINNISDTGKVMSLTIGKVYINKQLDIHNDNGVSMFCYKDRFKLLSEIREEKINEILTSLGV